MPTINFYLCIFMNRTILTIVLYLLVALSLRAEDFVFTPVNVSQGLSDNQIRYIQQLPDGRMVFTTSGNVNLYDGVRFTYIHRTPEHIHPLSKYNGYYRIYQTGDSLLWIKDMHRLSCLNLREEQYMAHIPEYFRQQGITDPIEDLFVDDQSRIWLLTANGLICSDTSESFDIHQNGGDLQDLTTDNECLYLFYDTGEVVCYCIRTKEERYRRAAYPVDEQDMFRSTSLVVKGKNGFYQLRNSSKGGFFFFDPESRTWEKMLETDYVLNTLIFTPNETAYISCLQGLWIIHPQSKEKRYLPILKTVEGNSIDTEISTLYYDKQGGLWLGTVNRGLLYYHPSRYKFTYIGRSYFPQKTTKDIIVQAFAEDSTGKIYLRCHSDIYQYHQSGNNSEVLTPVSSTSLPEEVLDKLYQTPNRIFENQQYTALLTDIRGWIWAGTPDGLRLFQPNKQEEKIFYTDDGLSNNFIHGLLEDQNHNIWVTTSYGISQIKVDPESEYIYFVNFNSYDGTLDGEYTDGALFEASDGTLYFGGINGFNLLHPAVISSSGLPFAPLFTNLYIRGERIKTTPYTQQIELSYNQNFLTFEYSALNYQNPHQTCYRYCLEGVDTHWQEITAGRQNGNLGLGGILQASYTNLPAGKYTFKVMASNDKYQWNGNVSYLNITIHAPWWRTTTAYIFYVVFLLLILFAGIYLYTHVSRRRIERTHKEEILLLRIRNLIEQCSQLEAEKETYLTRPSVDSPSIEEEADESHSVDNLFLTKAIELVEKNLDAPNYSVEQLSRDLCMDRTGLYRKLITLLDKSPSLFIRHIRLQKAAQLILEGKLSITEIVEKVGFSSSSYLSKCFQEMYGCRPSEYAEKTKKST